MLWWALLLPLLVAASPLRTQVQADFRLTPTAVTSRLSIFCTVLNQTIQVVVQCNTVEVNQWTAIHRPERFSGRYAD